MNKTVYKLLTEDMKSRKGFFEETEWKIDELKTVETPALEKLADGSFRVKFSGLCTTDYLHAFPSKTAAAFIGPSYVDVDEMNTLWEAEGDVQTEGGLKVGCKSMKILRKVSPVEFTNYQRIKLGMLLLKSDKWSALHPNTIAWIDRWLSGEDRTLKTLTKVRGETENSWQRSPDHIFEAAKLYTRFGNNPCKIKYCAAGNIFNSFRINEASFENLAKQVLEGEKE